MSISTKKICVIGQDQRGIPLAAVIALKCPEMRVSFVQKNPEFIFEINLGRIPPEIYVPGIEAMLRKTQEKNLFFSYNEKNSIKESDIIFIMSNSKVKVFGEGENQTVDISEIEEAAYKIGENSENSKIIVENSAIPLKASECIRNILKRFQKPTIEFDVLSNPEFYEQGNPLQNLLHMDFVMIGSDNTERGIAAAKRLAGIYRRWIPPEKIIFMNDWSAELSKICASALLAQTYSAIQSLTVICEKEENSDVSVCKDVIGKVKKIGTGVSDFCFNVGNLPLAVRCLIYLCETNNFTESANYWRQVLEMFNFSKTKFYEKIISKLNGIISGRRIVLLGFAAFKNTVVTEGTTAADLCRWLLEEKALVNIYDTFVTKQQVINTLVNLGCQIPLEVMENSIMVFNDPYKATEDTDAIVLCSPWLEAVIFDFLKIFKSMRKPAYIFDMTLTLPHSKLLNIGFMVYTFGKRIDSPKN